jgi:hypothetical protein
MLTDVPTRSDAECSKPHRDPSAQVRRLFLDLPVVSEALTYGAPTWFVDRRRSFVKYVDPAAHRLGEAHVAVWAAASPGARQELVTADPRQFFAPPFGGSAWIGMWHDVDPNGPDWSEVREVIEDAHRHVAPHHLVSSLDHCPPGSGS